MQLSLYTYHVFPEPNPGHLSQDRGGCLDQVETRGLRGNLHFPLLDHYVQLHQILKGGGMLCYVNMKSSGESRTWNVQHSEDTACIVHTNLLQYERESVNI